MDTEMTNKSETAMAPLSFTQETESYLKSTARWSYFLSILGFLIVLFFLIVGIVFFFISGISNEYSDFQNIPFPMFFVGILYLIMAAIYFLPAYNLLKFGSKVLSGLNERNQTDIDEGLKNLKRLFIFYGVLAIISIVLMLAFIPMGLVLKGLM